MHPILFTLGGVPIYSHGFFFLLGLLVGMGLLIHEARRRRWPKEEVIPITLATLMLLRDHSKMQNGNLLKFGLAGYAVFRFFVEFVRNNRVIAFGMTGQQFFCIGLLIVVAVYYARRSQGLRRTSMA